MPHIGLRCTRFSLVKAFICTSFLLVVFVAGADASDAGAGDQTIGALVEAEGADLVRGHCSACHSLSIVTSQRGDRAYWLDLIRWMQATQNLWQIPAEHEEAILSYLVKHYAETEWGRRPNLARSLIGPFSTKAVTNTQSKE